MLARTPYKTAEELGIKDWYYEGLVKVLDQLKGGELQFVNYYFQENAVSNGFNMGVLWSETPECGSVGCISGWAYRNAGMDPNSCSVGSCWWMDGFTEQHRRAFARLTCPEGWMVGRHTPEQAAVALEAYLKTGEADWTT